MLNSNQLSSTLSGTFWKSNKCLLCLFQITVNIIYINRLLYLSYIWLPSSVQKSKFIQKSELQVGYGVGNWGISCSTLKNLVLCSIVAWFFRTLCFRMWAYHEFSRDGRCFSPSQGGAKSGVSRSPLSREGGSWCQEVRRSTVVFTTQSSDPSWKSDGYRWPWVHGTGVEEWNRIGIPPGKS